MSFQKKPFCQKHFKTNWNPVDRWGNKIKHKSRRKWFVWTSLQVSPLSDVFMKGNVFHEFQDQTASHEVRCLMVMFDCTVELVCGKPTVLLIDWDKKWSWRGSVHPGCFRHCDCTGLDLYDYRFMIHVWFLCGYIGHFGVFPTFK